MSMRSIRLGGCTFGVFFLAVAACGDDGATNGTSGSEGGGGTAGDGGGRAASTGPGAPSSASGETASSSAVTSSIAATSSTGDGGSGAGGPTSSSSGSGSCFDEPVFADEVCDDCTQVACCADLTACIEDIDACTDAEGSLDPGTDLGSQLIACMSSSCHDECGFGGICASGIGFGDAALDECVGAACCNEFEDCTQDGTDVDACLDCYNAGAGALCDAAIACTDGSGCFCGDGEVRCADGSFCLPQTLVCDGAENCDDGSDETDCSDDCADVATECADLVYTTCTCAFNDPCGWSGDGVCDASCGDVVANPFDDASDCGGPCQNVATECANGQYTECTCASGDPCAWSGDGYCDIACQQITATPFDDASDCATDDLVVSCTDPNDPIWAPECSCISNGGSGTPSYEGPGCDGGFGTDQFCCEDPGFPESGGGCRCYDDTGPNWRCTAYSADFCDCSFQDSAAGGTTCDDLPGPNGVPWLCCANAVDNQCYCYENSFGDTCGNDTPVSNCAAIPSGWQTPPQSCPGGTTPVLECSPGADCSSDFDCPGECFGDDPFCCPTCSGGSCETCCVSSGGSVSCF